MTDPGLQGMHDDGRDLHAALGGLLVDEPTAPWSAHDDARRGEALRTRRRTRTLGAIGIAAALVLVAGLVGPLRPWSASVAPGSSTPGLDKDAVSSMLEGFGWTVRDVADVRTEPDPTVTKWSVSKSALVQSASLTVRTWTSGAGSSPSGSALEACTRDNSCELISGSIADCVGSPCWSSRSTTITKGDDVTPAGTAVLLAYDDVAGVAVELVATPSACATCSQPVGTPPAFLSEAELQRVLGLVEDQLQPVPTTPTDDAYGVTGLLAGLGWTVNDVTVAQVPEGEPSLTTWTARRSSGADTFSGTLTVRTWAWDAGTSLVAVRPDSVVSACTLATCIDLATRTLACETGATCWSESSAITTATLGDAEAGSFVLLRQDVAGGRALEVVVGPEQCPSVCPGDPFPAFLSQSEAAQIADLVQQTLAAAPTVDPTTDGVRACTSDDVKLIPEIDPIPTPAGQTVLRIRVIPRNPDVACVLRGAPTVQPRGSGGVLGYTVVKASSSTDVALDENREAQFLVNFTLCAPVGGDLGVLRVTMPGGGDPLDVSVSMLVGVPSCAVGSTASTNLGVSEFQEANPRECTSGDVTMVAAKDTAGGQTGERSVRVEVRPSSPDVRCTLTQRPDVALLDAKGAALAFQQSSGGFQGVERARISTVLLREGVVGYVVLSKYRCDTGGTAVASLQLALADGEPVPVALPDGVGGLERCAGGGDSPGNTVWVSQWGQT